MLDFSAKVVPKPAQPASDIICALNSKGVETYYRFSVVTRFDKMLGITSDQPQAAGEESKEE